MTTNRVHIGATVGAIGILVAADTLLLLYLGRSLFPSQNILSLTAGFVVVEELILFGMLVHIAMTAERSIALPVHLGYVSVFVSSLLFTLLVIAVFDALLTFGLVSVKAYWTALTMRQVTLLVVLLGIHIVGIAQRASHHRATQQRTNVDEVTRACDRIFISAQLAGWDFEALGEAAERLRFCEGLRQNQPLLGEVVAKLSELEALARIGGAGAPKARASRLLNEVLVLSGRLS